MANIRVALGADEHPEDLGIFDFQKISVMEAIQLKARTGLTPKALVDGLTEMDAQAMQALVWMLRVRKGEVVQDPHTINFALGDLQIVEEPDPTPAPTSGGAAASTSGRSSTSSD